MDSDAKKFETLLEKIRNARWNEYNTKHRIRVAAKDDSSKREDETSSNEDQTQTQQAAHAQQRRLSTERN